MVEFHSNILAVNMVLRVKLSRESCPFQLLFDSWTRQTA